MKLNLYPVKEALETMVCPEHNEHPEAIINGENIELKACCEKFKGTLVEVAKEEIGKAGAQAISDEINGMRF